MYLENIQNIEEYGLQKFTILSTFYTDCLSGYSLKNTAVTAEPTKMHALLEKARIAKTVENLS